MITVKVGGDRTGLNAVGNLAGVRARLLRQRRRRDPGRRHSAPAPPTPTATAPSPFPNTQIGGANRDRRFWVEADLAPASGYYTNPSLGTGSPVAADPYRFQTGTQLRNGSTYSSTVDFMIGTGNTNNQASGGIWQNSRNNPTFPAQCGIDVALVLDLSNSVTDAQLVQLKAAANGFVDALTGTPVARSARSPSRPAAPAAGRRTPCRLTPVSTAAGATTVKNKINGYAKPGGNAGGTNWDRGICQVAQSTVDLRRRGRSSPTATPPSTAPARARAAAPGSARSRTGSSPPTPSRPRAPG